MCIIYINNHHSDFNSEYNWESLYIYDHVKKKLFSWFWDSYKFYIVFFGSEPWNHNLHGPSSVIREC